MSKYVIEIEEKPLCVFDKDTQTYFPRLWRVKGFNSLVLDEEGLSRLEELNSDYINENFGDLQDTAYQKGFEDGKAVHDKGCEGCMYQDNTIEHHPCGVCRNAYNNRWKAKDDKIEVGDEVKHKSDRVAWTAIVTRIWCEMLTLMDHNGASADNYPIEDFVKTGRHFDIASILEDMKHD